MFICRHHLLRVNVTKLLFGHTTSKPLFRAARPIFRHPAHARFTSHTAPAQTGTAAAADTVNNATHSVVADEQATSPSSPHETSWSTASPSEPAVSALRSTVLADMTADDVKIELSRAAEARNIWTVNQTVRRFLKTYEGQRPQDRDDIAQHILSLTRHRGVLQVTTVRSLLADLRERKRLSKVPIGFLAAALNSTLDQATIDGNANEISIYTTLSPIFLSSLSSRRPVIYKEPSHRLSHMQTLWILFKIIRRLIHLEQYKAVMPIFDELVKSGAIPAKAMHGLPSSGFTHIILTVLLRCCIDWGWRTRAAYILLETPRWDQARSPTFNQVLDEVVDFVLDSEEEPTTPGLAAALMVRIANNPEVITLPDRVIERFYEVMRKHQLLQQAQAFYRVTRSPAILQNRKYPAPTREGFMWLFRAAVAERQVHVARMLVKDLIDHDVPIHQLARAFVVIEAASLGNMTYARTLWERWKNDVFVVGDGGVALRLVSLTRSRIAAVEHSPRVEDQDKAQPLPQPTLGASGDANDTSEPQADLDRAQDVTPRISEGTHDSPATPGPADVLEEDRSDCSVEERVADYRAFAENVVATFRGIHEPLDRAPHKTLNALARLYIMMDNVIEGFAMLKIIMGRGQLPDVRDVNVALSALSVHNPRAASRVLERMIKLGIEPNVVSFGTVIHHAVLKGDMALVSALITRSRQVGIAQLDYKTVSTLIRAAISEPYASDAPHHERLKNAKNLVYSLTDSGYAVSPAMATDCIHAALRADEPVTAFEFWQLLVDGKVEHTDWKQKALRARISRNLRRHVQAGVLAEATARSMAWELGLRPSSWEQWLEETDEAKQEQQP